MGVGRGIPSLSHRPTSAPTAEALEPSLLYPTGRFFRIRKAARPGRWLWERLDPTATDTKGLCDPSCRLDVLLLPTFPCPLSSTLLCAPGG